MLELYVCRRFVKLGGGFPCCESEPLRGAGDHDDGLAPSVYRYRLEMKDEDGI